MTAERTHGAASLFRRILVWDLPTRVVHWTLAALIFFLWWTAETDRLAWHKLAGFAVAGLLVFRLFWGFFGSHTARFAHFVRGPRFVWRYIRGTFGGHVGHNPLGALSVVALLVLTAAETVLGLYSIDDDGLEPGPLAPYVSIDASQQATHWHSVLFNVLFGFIALHVVAILFYLARRQNLVGAMITGRKFVHVDLPAPRPFSLVALVIGVLLAAATAFGLWWLDNH